MKWIVVCLVVAGASAPAFAAMPPSLNSNAARAQCPLPKVVNATGLCVCPHDLVEAPAPALCRPCPPEAVASNGQCVCRAHGYHFDSSAWRCVWYR